jgi:tetratricopeptide (TPR) repeat protein
MLAAVLRAERGGDYLGAFDLATRGIAAYPDDLPLRHRAVLALARSGATRRARALMTSLGLDGHADAEIAALDARLAKDEALAAAGDERTRLARIAAERYAGVHARSPGHYPAVNAATLYRLAGDRAASDALARAALDALGDPATGLAAYWAESSRAEAELLLGDVDAARATLERARAANPDDHAALATTRRQLGWLVAELGVDAELLRPLEPPSVVHYVGAAAAHDADAIARQLVALDVGYGFGSLSTPGDVAFAEALLSRGAALHVVMPSDDDPPLDDAWRPRYLACRAKARVTYATADAIAIDDELARHTGRLAMGMALLRARHLQTRVTQLACADDVPEVVTWRGRGNASIVLGLGEAAGPKPEARQPYASGPRRVVRAMLFGDVKGFSRLVEEQVPAFVDTVLGAFGRVLDEFAASVDERNTWGDGLYLVVRDTAVAARCALALQRAMTAVDLAAAGLPPHLGLRLAGHVGPVYSLADALANRTSHFGTHVTRTARIEPVTPEGDVFVTEAFAAELALDDPSFRCDYVGNMPAAKGFGAMRMHSLKRATGSRGSHEP